MWTVPCLTFGSVEATIPVKTEVFGEVAGGMNARFHSPGGLFGGSWRALELIVRPGCRADN